MTYKEVITAQCEWYAARHPEARFIGYNTIYGSRMYGTLSNIPKEQCIETPVCENLMIGLAMGMSLEGYRPVVCFERHDFMLIALDAIVNHLDKMPWMSGDRYNFPVIIRAIVGSKSPIDAGPQHTQDYSRELESMLRHTLVVCPDELSEVSEAWNYVGKHNSGAVVIIEHRDWYDKQI